MNMSYCQFENTAKDLEQCWDTIDNLVDSNEEPLSDSELKYAKRLADVCANILERLSETNAAKGLELHEIDFNEVFDEIQENLVNQDD